MATEDERNEDSSGFPSRDEDRDGAEVEGIQIGRPKVDPNRVRPAAVSAQTSVSELRRLPLWVYALVLLLLVPVLAMCSDLVAGGPTTASSGEAEDQRPSYRAGVVVMPSGDRIRKADAVVYCRNLVRRNLVAPSTVRFVGDADPNQSENRWTYRVRFDAQNSFGAMIRDDFLCLIDGDSGYIGSYGQFMLDQRDSP